MRNMRITSIWFEMDGLDLVDMIFNPMDWPTFALKFDVFQDLFEDVSLIYNLRSRNDRGIK